MDFVINEQILMITKVRLHSQLTETHNRDIIVVVILNVVLNDNCSFIQYSIRFYTVMDELSETSNLMLCFCDYHPTINKDIISIINENSNVLYLEF